MQIDELKAKAEEMLDKYERFNGVSEFQVFNEDEIAKYFNMSHVQLSNLSAMECGNASYMLAQYSYYLQRMFNRESSNEKWVNDQINKLICDKLGQYPEFTKHDIKIALMAKENDVLRRLQEISVFTHRTMERFKFLSSSVKNMCDVMLNLQRAKSYQNKANSYE